MRICIVTPGQLGSNPRVVKEARALVGAGHQVTVICTKVADFVEPRDRSVIAEADYEIRRIPFDDRLRWRLRRVRQMVARALFGLGWRHWPADHAISPMLGALRRYAAAVRADLYIAHYPAALPAAAAAARHGARYAFDAEDFHLGDLPDVPQHEMERRVIGWTEGRFMPGAAYVTAASPMIAAAYAERYPPTRPVTVLNVFSRAGAPEETARPDGAVSERSIYWFSQVIGPGRGLETLIEAAAISAARPHVHLRGTPQGDYVASLSALAAERGMLDRLHLLDPIAPALLESDAARFDVGYVGERAETKNRQIALTNKLFSYLSSGLSIIASDVPAHRAIAPELEGAMVLFPADDPVALAAAIDRLLLDPERLARARRRAWELGQGRFSWEEEQSVLLAVVDKALRGAP